MGNSINDIDQKRDMERHIQSILLSIITAGIIALFGFCWSINGAIIQMRTESAFRYKAIEEATTMLQAIQSDLRKIEERVHTLEERNKKK